MGTRTQHQCRSCGTSFEVEEGGGFVFDILHCDRCGDARRVGHEEMGDIHLRYVKGLDVPYAIVRAASDARIREGYPGAPLSEPEYETAVQASVDACGCGGSYRYDAPARCPGCGATRERWTESEWIVDYD